VVPLQVIKDHLTDLMLAKTPIRVHGNGFIQIEPTPRYRINVWSPVMIPAQQVYTGVHDHKADFTSMVWYGVLYNRIFKPSIIERTRRPADAIYRVWTSVPSNRFEGDEDTKLVATNEWVVGSLNPVVQTLNSGMAYYTQRYSFHETEVKRLTITCMNRFNFDESHQARVMVKVDEEPSNEFDKHGMTPDAIWAIVFGMLNEEIRKTMPRKTFA
jgi:hypothetical protein